MTTFTKGLGPHLISRGIRVNAIAPGPVWTPLIHSSYPPEQVILFNMLQNNFDLSVLLAHMVEVCAVVLLCLCFSCRALTLANLAVLHAC